MNYESEYYVKVRMDNRGCVVTVPMHIVKKYNWKDGDPFLIFSIGKNVFIAKIDNVVEKYKESIRYLRFYKTRYQISIPPEIRDTTLDSREQWLNVRDLGNGVVVFETESEQEDSKKKIYNKRGRPWTKEEEDFLLENYEKMSLQELSEKLERTPKAIKMKYYQLKNGKRSNPEKRYYPKHLYKVLKKAGVI